MKKFLIALLLVLMIALPVMASAATVYSLKLSGNPTTGYDWSNKADVEGIVEIKGEYTVSDPELTGAPGYYEYTINGLAAGDATLTFTYSRSFEENSEVVSVAYTFHVDDALNVTCVSSEVILP